MTAALQAQELPRLTWRQCLLRLMPWHKRLALLACLGIFSWAGSGMLHPLMGYLQPRPQTMATPQQVLPLDNLRSPAQVLGAAGVAQVQGLRLLVLAGEPYYQARLAGELQPRYWHARTGQAVELAAAHAESLARHYLGRDEPLAYAGSIQRFTSEYAFINRLLPVARVDTQRDDQLRLYVDLFHDRLGTLVDERKAWFSAFFQTMHSFRWLDAAGPLRPVLMLVLLASIVSATLFGVALFIDPLDGALASRVQDADRTEGWTFAYLHKWEFLAGLGNGYKHLLLGIVALAHVLLALVGLSLLRRGQHR